MQLITDVLKYNSSLKNSNLVGSNLGSEGAIAIAESLKHNNSLKELDLSNNNIDETGGKALRDSFIYHHSLKKLDLRFNDKKLEGADYCLKGSQEYRDNNIVIDDSIVTRFNKYIKMYSYCNLY